MRRQNLRARICRKIFLGAGRSGHAISQDDSQLTDHAKTNLHKEAWR
jgi:hypothetical protein